MRSASSSLVGSDPLTAAAVEADIRSLLGREGIDDFADLRLVQLRPQQGHAPILKVQRVLQFLQSRLQD